MTNILKISSLFFSVSVRKPMIIQRPLTTTFTVNKSKVVFMNQETKRDCSHCQHQQYGEQIKQLKEIKMN